jgi:hypothetical protein
MGLDIERLLLLAKWIKPMNSHALTPSPKDAG